MSHPPYKAVLVKIDEDLHTRLRLLSVRQKTTLQQIGTAALVAYAEKAERAVEMVQAS